NGAEARADARIPLIGLQNRPISGLARTMSKRAVRRVETSVDKAEVAKFTAMAQAWWNPEGEFRPLHRLNPVRLTYVRDSCARRFERDIQARRPLADLRLVDIGCGGGLLCEPLARLGARVTGIDAGEQNVEIARQHARESELDIDYRQATAESVVEA